MTLTTRLSLFFLGALAFVLIGFSVTVYLLVQTLLYRQAEDGLEATLHTLAAGAETEPGGLEWEPHERHLHLDENVVDGQLRICINIWGKDPTLRPTEFKTQTGDGCVFVTLKRRTTKN